MSSSRVATLSKFCSRTANELSDTTGFVSLRKLSERFKTPVLFRPLLVEAMLASQTEDNSSDGAERSRWTVLVDSERFKVAQEQFDSEEALSPLPERVRNTVAHEILHSLGFHSTESGFDFRLSPKKGEKTDAFVERLERETEKLSPLLLIPQRVLSTLAHKPKLEINDFSQLRACCGVSRDVLVNRLKLLSDFDDEGLRHGTSLQDMALGIGEWVDAESAQLLGWPLFLNFENNRNPRFLEKLPKVQSILSARISDDSEFILNGGKAHFTEFNGHHEWERLDYLKMRVRLTVEDCGERRQGRFLFMVRKLDQ